MGRVLCISSQTVYGPVGNSAASPPMLADGREVMQVPTVLLSNHPGLGAPSGQPTPDQLLRDILARLEDRNAFQGLDAVMTGYFASAGQIIAAAKQIAVLKARNPSLHVLVDPVIGDDGALYVPLPVAEGIRDELLPLATITTPNLFEMNWLTGSRDVGNAVARLAVTETIVTSVPAPDNTLATELHFGGGITSHAMPRREGVPHGTGDHLAGCYLSARIDAGPRLAFARTMARLEAAIDLSAGQTVLRFPKA